MPRRNHQPLKFVEIPRSAPESYGMIGPAMDGWRGERTNGHTMRILPNGEIQSHLLCTNPVLTYSASSYLLGGFLALDEG